ncbi:fimbrial protein FimV [uncultured Sutterella sp.]|uniref:FimV/HubP-related protein n=1 Tax=uncultured Sutterella sp. TaxID=286133 RepID=UPI00266FA48B|nr:fimbrial protein FimV [uncultured Sutterella sp.]
MFRKSMLAGATALAILGFAVSAQAVSLGDLTVESKPGEPLEALLEINDLDLTISPLLVRVAPPATYLREGVNWPSQVQDLKLARDGSNGTVRLRLYGEQALQSGSFPLLMEMNAGGTVTVRAYEVQTKDGSFVVTPSAERTTVKGEPRRLSPEPLVVPREPEAAQDNQEAKKEGKAETKSESKAESGAAALAVKTAAAPQKEVSAASAEKQGKIRRKGRYAPNVVKEYVALNGFDASQAFHVQQDMTLWSVALLYWPSYRGATLEQLVIAFRNLNRTAFKEGDPGRLEVRSVLNPPTVEEVLAIDPVAAFHEVHGADTAIPGPTQNLIDAQRISGEAAAKVADAQDRERTAGKAPEVVAEAGQQALEEEKAEAVREEAEAAEARAEAKAAEEAAEKAAAAEAAAAEKPAESAKPAEPAADAPKVEPVKTEAPARPADAAGSGGTNNLLFWGVGALVLALLAFLGLRSRKREEDPVEEKKPVAVQIQKDVPPTSEAQLKAVSTTVDEAVKNGTTAGAMGAGAMAYAMAQKNETRNSEKALKSEGTGAPADQPWLEPDDDELPPLDEEEKGPVLGASRQAAAVLEGVSLELDDAVAPAQTSAPAAAPAAATPAPAEQKPAEQPEPAEPETDKERALAKALDAKLKLATSFVSLGAVDEALELLQEVKRRGGDELRHRAEVLEERIKTQTDPK